MLKLKLYYFTTAACCEEPTHWKRPPYARKGRGQDEKKVAEGELVGWHHRFSGHEFEQTSGDIGGKGRLEHSSLWGCKESDMTERRNSSHEGQEAETVQIDRFRTETLPWIFPLIVLNSSLCLHACCCLVVKSCPTLCDPMDHSMPGSSVLH